jgi:hypothetical protein
MVVMVLLQPVVAEVVMVELEQQLLALPVAQVELVLIFYLITR